MLVRRFTIVCFILMLFGMWFASMVARFERPVQVNARNACVLVDSPICRSLVSY